MSELKITQEKVTAAFSEANDCPKAISILTALFGKQKPDYTDYHNIKTYEDACEAIGVKPIVRLLVEDEDGHKEEVADIAHLAYIKLCTIARALNNDPNFPRFTKDEYRYTPWFYLYNQKEIDEIKDCVRKGYFKIYSVKNSEMVKSMYGKLHYGELEVIVAAKELGLQMAVIDEKAARKMASEFLVDTIGILGILILAKQIREVYKARC